MSRDSKKNALYYHVLHYQKENIALLNRYFSVTTLPDPDHDTPQVLQDIDVVFAPLGFFWGKDKIDCAKNLKIIGSNTTSTPHIDVTYAHKRNIEVISLEGKKDFLKTITPTAEFTFGLILALLRRIPWAFESVCGGIWNRRLFGGKAMLSTMALGIVGLGRLGKMVAQYGKCFGMKVYYFDPYVFESHTEGIMRMDSLEELVSTSDIMTIHIPLSEETKGLFNELVFSHIKKGAYLVNTSRGEIVDHQVLLKYLESGHLGGAAVDVFEGEFERDFSQRLNTHPLIAYAKNYDNLLITPHIGGSTIDAWRLTEEYVIKFVIDRIQELP